MQRPAYFLVQNSLASLQPGPGIARWSNPQVRRCGWKGSRNGWTWLENATEESTLAHKQRGRTRTFRGGKMLQREILWLRIAYCTHFRSATADLVRAVPKSLEFLDLLPRRSVGRARNSARQSVRLPAEEKVARDKTGSGGNALLRKLGAPTLPDGRKARRNSRRFGP